MLLLLLVLTLWLALSPCRKKGSLLAYWCMIYWHTEDNHNTFVLLKSEFLNQDEQSVAQDLCVTLCNKGHFSGPQGLPRDPQVTFISLLLAFEPLLRFSHSQKWIGNAHTDTFWVFLFFSKWQFSFISWCEVPRQIELGPQAFTHSPPLL